MCATVSPSPPGTPAPFFLDSPLLLYGIARVLQDPHRVFLSPLPHVYGGFFSPSLVKTEIPRDMLPQLKSRRVVLPLAQFILNRHPFFSPPFLQSADHPFRLFPIACLLIIKS